MHGTYRTEWVERSGAINAVCSGAGETKVFVGGRFVFTSEEEEDRLIPLLTAWGYTTRDCGQCEVVAGNEMALEPEAVRKIIRQMRDTAAELGVRLQAIEAGDPEAGDATVLAAEVGYRPWWSVP